MTSKPYTIDLEKDAKRLINKETLQKQIDYVKERITSGGREKRGWGVINDHIDHRYIAPFNGNEGVFATTLTIQCKPTTARQTYDSEFSNISEIVRGAIKTHRWEIKKINGEEPKADIRTAEEFFEMASTYIHVDLPEDWKSSFEHLYERDAHIEIIHDAIEVAIESNWKHRFHVLLYGPPGCGKSDITLSIKDMVGSDSVLEFDATATTSAGAIRDLNERDELPRILLVEEIEKADENSLRWLLGLLDIRGNIRKLTYRGRTQRDTKMLCVATVNDVDLFRRMMFGALASRFSHQLYCPRPDRALLGKILQREVREINGNEAWINPTLDYLDRHSITDPRKAMAICLTGRDRLLTGQFQDQMDKTMEGLPTANVAMVKRLAAVGG